MMKNQFNVLSLECLLDTRKNWQYLSLLCSLFVSGPLLSCHYSSSWRWGRRFSDGVSSSNGTS